MAKANEFQPYVGPRPFEREDWQRFFGRERESSELLSRVIAHPAVLIYSQSGAGKTSLLNASLVPLLEKEGFEVLPTARVRGLAPEDIAAEDISNLYVFNVLLSWVEGSVAPKDLARMRLVDFLNSNPRRKGKDGEPLPRVAVFDQFEELFTFYPERWSDREDFFDQVSEALEADRMLRVVFVMREDYIAELDPYVFVLPEKLRTRFRLERLREDSALEAVKAPLVGTEYSFGEAQNGQSGVAEQLVNNLLKVPVETAAGVATVIGEFIEPVQLQVVCQNLWQKLDHGKPGIISQEQLEAFGDVDQALSDFYEDAIAKVAHEPGVNEGQLRRWFERTLITPAGTRGTVYRGRDETGGIPNSVVDKLVDQHVIRGELRGGARWYELTHDRLIKPIIASNNLWMLQRSGAEQTRQLLEAKAAEWARSSRPTSGLLDEAELLEATRWLESPSAADVGYSDALIALVQASRAKIEEAAHERERILFVEQERRAEAEHALVEDQQRHIEAQRRASQRLRNLAAALAVMFLLSIAAAAFAVNKSRLATRQSEVATRQTALAQEKEREVSKLLKIANDEGKKAQLARDAAVYEKSRAEELTDETKAAKAEVEKRQTEAEQARRLESEAHKKAQQSAEAYKKKSEEYRALAEKYRDLADREGKRGVAYGYKMAGNAWATTGDIYEARAKYESALETFQEIEDTEGEADTFTDMGVMYLQRGRNTREQEDKQEYLKKAEKYFQDSINIRRPKQDNDLAVVLNYLGVAYDVHEKYKDAADPYKDALEIRQRVLSANNPELALSYSNLAGVYQNLGKLSEAENLYERAITIRRALLQGKDADSYEGRDLSLTLGNTLANLGLTYFYHGKYAQAEPRYQESLQYKTRVKGADDPQVAVQLHNLALLYFMQARYKEAEDLELRAKVIYEKAGDNDGLGSTLTVLARVNQALAKYSEAETFYSQALGAREKAVGKEHISYAVNLHYLAQLYATLSRYDEAERLEKTALNTLENKSGPTSWRTSVSLNSLASIYIGQQNRNKYGEAEKFFIQALENIEKPTALGPEHPEVANTLNGLARLYLAQDKLAEAEPLLERSLAIRKKIFEPNHPDIGTNLNDYGVLYFKFRKYAEAEQFYKEALRIRENKFGPEHPSVADTLENYAALLHTTKRDTEAAAMEGRAKAIRAKFSQPN